MEENIENENIEFKMNEDVEQDNENNQTNYKRLIFPLIAFSLPLIIVIIFGVIIFTNKYQLDLRGKYVTCVIVWILMAIVSTTISAIFLPITLVKWRKGMSKAPYVAGGIVSFINVISIVIGVLLVKDIRPNFTATSLIEMSVVSKRNEGPTVFLKMNFKNTGEKQITSLTGTLTFYQISTKESYTYSNVKFPSTTNKESTYYFTFKAGEQIQKEVYFDATEISTVSLSDLKITYKLAEMRIGLSTKKINEDSIYIYGANY